MRNSFTHICRFHLKSLVFFVCLFFSATVSIGSDDLPTIIIDPGHGGTDSGAIGYYQSTEKQITLTLASRIVLYLANKCHVILTREKDTYISLLDRTAKANYTQPMAFISLHLGASYRFEPEGIGTYYWQPSQGVNFFDDILKKQNDQNGHDNSGPLLWDHMQRYHLNSSKFLAQTVHSCILSEVEIYDRKVRGAPLFVLAGADMPAILIEIGYISRPKEEKKLLRQAYLNKIAQGFAHGIDQFIEKISYGIETSLQY
ncbi:N-acetylmuramoyl-L-alanine amidase [Candidatus Magnetomorum sp. HK-1]|nr:N-acetylmuramoyl-L-alanine amidase [Candidatus Magnetomorum sp. HK-1]